MNERNTTHASFDEHLAVTNVLYRFGAGHDLNDLDVLASAFTADATVDFGPCGRKLGFETPPLSGRSEIVRFLSRNAAAQTTTHIVVNPRVQADGARARLRAMLDIHHMPRGDHARRFQMVNWYEAELFRDGAVWAMSRLVIDNAWFNGDPGVLSEE